MGIAVVRNNLNGVLVVEIQQHLLKKMVSLFLRCMKREIYSEPRDTEWISFGCRHGAPLFWVSKGEGI